VRSILAAATKPLPTDAAMPVTGTVELQPRFVAVQRHSVAVASTLVVFGLVFCSISLVNHYLFRSYALDLGVFNNALYDYAHLRLNHYSLVQPLFYNFLADHFSLLVPMISPLYWLLGSYTLLVVQIVAILLGGYGVYVYFSERTQDRFLPLLAMVHFFSVWGIYSALAFDYHENVVGTMFVPWLLHYFDKGRARATIVLFLLILVSKESMALWMMGISAGLMLLHFKEKRKVLAALLMGVISLLYFMAVINWVLPTFGGESAGPYYYHFKYSVLGKSFSEAIAHVLLHPVEFVSLMFVNHLNEPLADGIKWELHYVVLLSGGWALLLRPKYLVMLLPIYAQKLFNDEFQKWGLNYQYSIEFVPILSIAVFTVVLSLRTPRAARLLAVGAVLLTMGTTVWKLESQVSRWYVPQRAQFYRAWHYQQGFDVMELYRALQVIPNGAKVSAQSFIVPHLAFREKIYQFPAVNDADYIVILDKEYPYPLDAATFQKKEDELLASSDWQVIYAENKTYIFRRSMATSSGSGHRAEWLDYQVPAEMVAGNQYAVSVAFRNAGDVVWPARGAAGGATGAVDISYHWLPAEGGAPVVWDGTRTSLSHDIAPGEALTLTTVSVTAPPVPGTYRLQLGLVEEEFAWFEQQGAQTLTVPVSVGTGGD